MLPFQVTIAAQGAQLCIFGGKKCVFSIPEGPAVPMGGVTLCRASTRETEKKPRENCWMWC